MLLPKPILHEMARSAIAELAKAGIACAPDEILWLQEMAAKVVYPTRADELLYLDLPVPCGNTLLWPLSIGARLWLKNYGQPWFQGTDMEDLVFAFAMAHSRRPEIFQELTSQFKARLQVAQWAAGLTATRAELNEAFARCISPEDYDLVEVQGGPHEKKEAPSAVEYGDIVALLCHFYGETPEHWLWKTGEDQCADLLNKIAHLLPTEKQVSASSVKFRAHAQFLAVVTHIRKRSEPQRSEIRLNSDPLTSGPLPLAPSAMPPTPEPGGPPKA